MNRPRPPVSCPRCGPRNYCSRCGRKIRTKVVPNGMRRATIKYTNHAFDCPQRGEAPDRYVP